MYRPLPSAALAALLLVACAEDSETTCDAEIGDATSRYGAPEDVTASSSDDVSITTLYWWSRGRALTFVGTSDGCEVTTRTFSSI